MPELQTTIDGIVNSDILAAMTRGESGTAVDGLFERDPKRDELAEFAARIRQERHTLSAPNPQLSGRLHDLCIILAECLARNLHERDCFPLDLDAGEKRWVLAVALALGWSPVGRLCSEAEFFTLANNIELPLELSAQPRVVSPYTVTLNDVLNGFDQPAIGGPFVDVYCVTHNPSRSRSKTSATETNVNDDDNEADEDTDGLNYQSIEEILVVGQGVGETRRVIQDLALSTALATSHEPVEEDNEDENLRTPEQSRGKGGLVDFVTDGLIHIQSRSAMALSPQKIKQMHRAEQRALNMLLRETRTLSNSSRFVRLHTVDKAEIDRINARVKEFRATSCDTSCLLTLVADEKIAPIALPLPIPVRKHKPNDKARRETVQFFVPPEIVTGPFFERKVGQLEDVLLKRLAENAKAREEFHTHEKNDDRQKMAEFIARLTDLMDRLPDRFRDDLLGLIHVDKDLKDDVKAESGHSLVGLFRDATRSIRGGETILQSEVSAFSAVISVLSQLIPEVLKDREADLELKESASRVKERLDEIHWLNVVVDHREGTITVLANKKKATGGEWMGRILPESVRLHIKWESEMRELRRQIERSRGSGRLREWTASLILDLILRNENPDFQGPAIEGYAELKRAVRPLLLLSWQEALQAYGCSDPEALATPNLAFQVMFDRSSSSNLAKPVRVRITPKYFFDARYSALSAAKGQRLPRLDHIASWSCPGKRSECRPIERIVHDFRSLREDVNENNLQEKAQCVRSLLVDLSANPLMTIGAVFDARNSWQGSRTPATKRDNDLLAGLFVWQRAVNLYQSHAEPAALALLKRAVELGHSMQPPFDIKQDPQNCLPDIPWFCLWLVATNELFNPISEPSIEAMDHGRSPRDWIRSWIVFTDEQIQYFHSGQRRYVTVNVRRASPVANNLPRDAIVADLIKKCIELCEDWCPSFLHAVYSTGSPATFSIYLRDMWSIVSGTVPERKESDQDYREGWADRNDDRVKLLRTAYQRLQAEETKLLLAPLVRIRDESNRAIETGERGVSLYEKLHGDLNRISCIMGGVQTRQVEQLLDNLFGAQHRLRVVNE